ncbi:MAG: sel1 repeat family protein [Legionellales bacterium]|nr:sel1 repeat family protein [Legionellales bacterium]
MYSVNVWDEVSESWVCENILEDSDYLCMKEDLMISAKKGDHVSMHKLFNLSLQFQKDIQEGVGWLEKSAEAGNLEAQVELADLCLLGFHLKTGYVSEEGQEIYNFINNKNEFDWLLKAANQGHIGSMFEVGDHYAKSDQEVFDWYMKATNLGGKGAEERIGYMYLYGKGV